MAGAQGGERQKDMAVRMRVEVEELQQHQHVFRRLCRALLRKLEFSNKGTASKLNEDINNSASVFTKKTGFLER